MFTLYFSATLCKKGMRELYINITKSMSKFFTTTYNVYTNKNPSKIIVRQVTSITYLELFYSIVVITSTILSAEQK